mgnify:CR=1 FL=1
MKILFSRIETKKTQTKFVFNSTEIAGSATQLKIIAQETLNVCKTSKEEFGAMDYGIRIDESVRSRDDLRNAVKENKDTQRKQNKAQRKMNRLKRQVQNQLNTKYFGFADRIAKMIKDPISKTPDGLKKINDEVLRMSDEFNADPTVSKAFDKYFEFGSDHTRLLAGVAGYKMLHPEKKAFSKAALKNYVWVTVLFQPIVANAAAEVVPVVKPILKTFADVLKNTIYGAGSGELYDEFANMLGKNGDPAEYVVNGKTHQTRMLEKIKDPIMLKDLSKMKEVMGHEFVSFYEAKETYKTKPEKMESQIDNLADFSATVIQNKLKPAEIEKAIRLMNNNEWDDQLIKRAFAISHLGSIMKFMDQDASKAHSDKFFEALRNGLDSPKNKELTDYKINTYFPGIDGKNMTEGQKKNVLGFLSHGVSGLAIMGVVGTMLFGKLFSTVAGTFRSTEVSSKGHTLIGKKFKRMLKKFKTGAKWIIHPFTYPFRKIKRILSGNSLSKNLKRLQSPKKGDNKNMMFVGDEIKNLEKLKKSERKAINKDIQNWFKNNDGESAPMSRENFWNLENVKRYAEEYNEAK